MHTLLPAIHRCMPAPVPERVAILITDGAPNQDGRTSRNNGIGPATLGRGRQRPGHRGGHCSMIESVIHEASLRGGLADAIDETFDPIRRGRQALNAGDMIDLRGQTGKPAACRPLPPRVPDLASGRPVPDPMLPYLPVFPPTGTPSCAR